MPAIRQSWRANRSVPTIDAHAVGIATTLLASGNSLGRRGRTGEETRPLVWEVEVVTAENKVMEVHIDAESGAVIDVEDEKSKKDKKHEKK